jgi:hypothetical protein
MPIIYTHSYLAKSVAIKHQDKQTLKTMHVVLPESGSVADKLGGNESNSPVPLRPKTKLAD